MGINWGLHNCGHFGDMYKTPGYGIDVLSTPKYPYFDYSNTSRWELCYFPKANFGTPCRSFLLKVGKMFNNLIKVFIFWFKLKLKILKNCCLKRVLKLESFKCFLISWNIKLFPRISAQNFILSMLLLKKEY